MKPVVAIIGRPNVGKSTLFNVIAGKNIAIVHDLPGVTRDRNYADVSCRGVICTLVDTGGFDPGIDDSMSGLVQDQARLAAEEADAIIFLLDGQEGLMPGDHEIRAILRRSDKPVLYVVNKVDNDFIAANMTDFYGMGVDNLLGVSAKGRRGIPELMQCLGSHLPEIGADESSADETVVSIIGRPNVGKSSIINKIVGRNRLLVSDQAGTTRDPVDTLIQYHGRIIRFIDTAGIRKKSSINYNFEKYCVFRALRCINRSSICMLVLDASQGVSTQDAKLAAQVFERYRACIIVLNKWDLVEKDNHTHEQFRKQVRHDLAFMDFAPIVTVSALTGLRVRSMLGLIGEVADMFAKRIPTGELNRALSDVYAAHPPPRGNNGRVTKIYYGTQVTTAPAVLKVFTNNVSAFTPAYRRYLERSIRQRCGLGGVPVCLQIVARGKEINARRQKTAR